MDFLIGGEVGIEVKASKRISQGDLKGLIALSQEVKLRKKIVVSTEPRERTTDEGVLILPVQTFFRSLWEDQLLQ